MVPRPRPRLEKTRMVRAGRPAAKTRADGWVVVLAGVLGLGLSACTGSVELDEHALEHAPTDAESPASSASGNGGAPGTTTGAGNGGAPGITTGAGGEGAAAGSSSASAASGSGGAGTLPTCGDGNPDPTEACDDGNLIPGDGCDAMCTVETGFGCVGAPSSCHESCGDGLTVGSETCDYLNPADLSGCSYECAACQEAEPTPTECNAYPGTSWSTFRSGRISVKALAKTALDGTIVVGSFIGTVDFGDGTLNSYYPDDSAGFVAAFDANGATLWSREIDPVGLRGEWEAAEVAITANGDVHVAAVQSYSDYSWPYTDHGNIHLYEYTADGVPLARCPCSHRQQRSPSLYGPRARLDRRDRRLSQWLAFRWLELWDRRSLRRRRGSVLAL